MNKIFKLVLGILLIFCLQSCQSYSDGRILKKFISRFNAGEYSCAAAYVYPGDRMNVAFFAKEVKELAPNAFLKLQDYHTEGDGDNRYIKADLKWENVTPDLRNYFQEIGCPVTSEGCQTVNLKIRETPDGEVISFIWGIPNVLSDNLWIASVKEKDGKPIEKVLIYGEPKTKSKSVGVLDHDIIVGQEDDNGWLPVYQVEKNGSIQTRYIHNSENIELDRTAYFTLGIFDSMSVIVALIIIIVIIVPLFYLHSFIEGIFSGLPVVGPIVIIALILGIIYIIYQLLEKILFEIFIINLPY